MGTPTHFPIAILNEGTASLSLIEKPEDLPRGIAFRVVGTNVTTEHFSLLERFARLIADKLVSK